ncbi:VOC family protein [Streptomyces sp. NPDC005438]|uniref:VOC family protein n=1 Tax=Streptomyces sp. NPDC005438 TaxID=3156880 RepID=UPI00339EE0F5
MTNQAHPTQVEFTKITPYLFYPDGDAAVEWLVRVLGFGPAHKVPDEKGQWTEGEVEIGPVRVALTGAGDRFPENVGRSLLIVNVSDVDAQYARIRDAGVDLDPPRDEDYGPRSCHVTDPWGYQWYFWQGDAKY